MWFFIAGILLMAGILGLFWLKDRMESLTLQRMAYHELTARLTVVAYALILFGGIMVIGDILRYFGVDLPNPFSRTGGKPSP